jgi:hypothetical protein
VRLLHCILPIKEQYGIRTYIVDLVICMTDDCCAVDA